MQDAIAGNILMLNQLSASLLVAALAILLEAFLLSLGPLAGWRWQAGLHSVCRGLERRLNRSKRSQSARLVRGLLAALLLLLPALALSQLLAMAVGRLPPQGALVLVALLLTGSLRFGQAWAISGRIRKAVLNGERDKANQLIERYGRREAGKLDEHGLLRAATEILARGFDRGLIAPLFWFLLFGLAGLLTLVAIQAADDVSGEENERLEAYGMVVRRLDMILHLIPSRLAGILMLLALLLAHPTRLRQAFRDLKRAHKAKIAVNGRWMLAPVAAGLNIALAGPIRQKGKTVKRGWIGDGTAKLEPEVLGRLRLLLLFGCLWLGIALAGAFIGAHNIGI